MRTPTVLAAGLALALGLCALPFSSFMADDFIQLAVLERALPANPLVVLNLYTLADGSPQQIQTLKNLGALPWFFDPAFKMAFFRPLSSASVALDHALFGLNPIGYQVHVALWFVVLVVGVGNLYAVSLRADAPDPTTRGSRLGPLALLLFTISGIHGMLCWTATRHIVIAGAIGTLALYAHVRWREEGWRPGRWLSVIGVALSLSASEAALGTLAFLFAYEAFGADGSGRIRMRASLPFVCLLAAYFAMYRLLGLGTAGGSDYLDPFTDPYTYLSQLPGRVVFLIAAMLMGGHADLWVIRPDFRPALIVAAMMITCAGGVLLRATWATLSATEQRTTRWLFAGTFLSALPFAGSPIGDRCLIVPWIGGALVIASMLTQWWTVIRRQPGLSNRLLSALCWSLAVIHLVLAPVHRLAAAPLFRRMMFQDLADAVGDQNLGGEPVAGRTVVVLQAPDLRIGLHGYFFRELYHLPMPAAWRVLSWAPFAHRFHRTAADTMEMELVDGELRAPFLVAGDVIEVSGMQATVTAIGHNGPTRVRFRFDRSLDDPTLLFLLWKDRRLQPIAPPAIGGTLDVPRRLGALAAREPGLYRPARV